MNATYDLKNYNITFVGAQFGTFSINNILKNGGLASGDASINVTWNGKNTQTIGADGSQVYNYSNDRSGILAIQFLFASSSNDVFQKVFEDSNTLLKKATFSVIIKDTAGLKTITLKNCLLKNLPEFGFGNTGTNRTWTILFGDYGLA